MHRPRASTLLLLAAFLAFYFWQTPGLVQGALTRDEVDAYLTRIGAHLSRPDTEREALLARLRAWALADDGEPVYMLNLMRYHDTLQPVPGAPAFAGTPAQANAHYEAVLAPRMLALGGYPLLTATTQGPSLLASPGTAAPWVWDRLVIVRQPSRRAFLEMLSDPAYAEVEPLKEMAQAVVLTPLAARRVVPDPRWLVGGLLLVLWLGLGWYRAARTGDR